MSNSTKLTLEPNIIAPYDKLLREWENYTIAFMGSGRGAGKSQAASKGGIVKVLQNSSFRIALIRSENTRLEQGIFTLVRMRAHEIDSKAAGLFSKHFEILDTKIKNRSTGEDVVFNYGLRSANSTSLESKKGKVKGLEKINLAIIEECQDIKDWEVIKTLIDTCIREKDFKIWFLFNPPKERDHWLYKEFYELVPGEFEGYDQLKPKEQERVLYLWSDYTQNPHLNEETVNRYAGYKHSANPDDYYHDILGLVPAASRSNAIVKRTHKSSWRDDNDNSYTLNHPFVKRMLDMEGFWWAAFDGGEHTNRKACVLGYHVKNLDRDICIKEFANLSDTHDLREVAMQAKEWLQLNQIFADVKLFGDPAIHNDGVCHLIESVFDKKLNTMQHFKSSTNPILREIYQNRKKKRLARIGTDMFELRSDNKPAIIVLKDNCKKLYAGLFEGIYRYELGNDGEPSDDIEQFTTGEYKHLTDICDALTYYLLAVRPFTSKERQAEQDKQNRVLYNQARLGWS